MRRFTLLAAVVSTGLLLFGCNQQPQPVATTEPYQNNPNVQNIVPEEWDYWAKDNFDLSRVGPLLERSRSTREFETYLNQRDSINNLDLNGDGYVDYLSVDEYPECNEYECGLSIYDRFGPDQVQEIGTVVFYRDEPHYSGARILIQGNDNIYGDNFYYETNWLERTLNIVGALFSPRREIYRSPYYYDYYPPDYVVYEIVDTPIYRTRIEQLYPQPAFLYTTQPTFIEKIKIKSPNNGLHLGQIKARLVKPTKEQAEFRQKNPGKPERVQNKQAENADKGDKPGKSGDSHGQAKQEPGPTKQEDKGNPNKGGADKADRGNPDKGGGPNKADKPAGPPQMKADKQGGSEKKQGGDSGKGKGKKP
jgi:hypothetical protein